MPYFLVGMGGGSEPGQPSQAGALWPQPQPVGGWGGGGTDVLFVFVHITHLSFNHWSHFDFHQKETCSNYFSVEVKRYLTRDLSHNNAFQEKPRPRGTREIPRRYGSREVLHSVRWILSFLGQIPGGAGEQSQHPGYRALNWSKFRHFPFYEREMGTLKTIQ